MRRRQGEEGEHLAAVLVKQRQRRPDDEPADGVRDEGQPAEGGARAPVADVVHHLLRQSDAHLGEVTFRVVLIGGRAQEDGVRVQQRNVVFHEAHVERIPLEAVHEDEEMHSSVLLRRRGYAPVERQRQTGIAVVAPPWALRGVPHLEEDRPLLHGRQQREVLHQLRRFRNCPPSQLHGKLVVLLADGLVLGLREVPIHRLPDHGHRPMLHEPLLPRCAEERRDLAARKRHGDEHLAP
mmetsp:Transcript_51148/g.155536  ORF Transcript_51148/g.155536 Transcript_51148/m.155536 type:complete len:238 (-) Transcript_51148:378-1091(-)